MTRTASGFVWRSERMPKPEFWDEDPPVSAMNAICDVHDVLFDWFLEAKPQHLCMHGAAVRIGDGLVCFPSVQKAGKSTLCVGLAAHGHTIYGDDVLAIEPAANHGFAMGIAPRLRKPLPGSLGSRVLRFIAERTGPSDRQWIYVNLAENEIAPLGNSAPIKAFVLLQRTTRGRAKLDPAPKTEMLKEILLQNFAYQVPAVEILNRLLHLTERASCYRLRYGSISDAALLLKKKFAIKQTRSGRKLMVSTRKRIPIPPPGMHDLSGRYRHTPGVEARQIGGEFFLAAPGPGTIHHLDRMASAAWRSLAQPKSARELIGLFKAAFPDMSRPKIARDVAKLLAFLVDYGLIVRTGARSRQKAKRRSRE